ncbi:MAG: hypothetical protein U0234_11910 [Sandaracinus sp.]
MQTPPRRSAVRPWAAALAASVLAFLGTALVAPRVPLDPGASLAAAIASYLFSYACVSACTLAVARVAPDLGPRALGVVVPVVALLVALHGAEASLATAAIVLGALLAAGTSAGAALGARVQAAGHLLPVAIVSSVADAVSVLTPGAPSQLAVDTPAVLSLVALPWPFVGTSDQPAILGVGDVAFAALYLAAARKHGLSLARTIVALAIGLGATALAVAATSLPLPALPALGLAIVVAHPEARRVPPADRTAAWIGCVLAIGVGVFVWARRAW